MNTPDPDDQFALGADLNDLGKALHDQLKEMTGGRKFHMLLIVEQKVSDGPMNGLCEMISTLNNTGVLKLLETATANAKKGAEQEAGHVNH
jgi:hypothetical protein